MRLIRCVNKMWLHKYTKAWVKNFNLQDGSLDRSACDGRLIENTTILVYYILVTTLDFTTFFTLFSLHRAQFFFLFIFS